jgi:hypothetical protein
VKKIFIGASSKALRAIAFSFALLAIAFVRSQSAQAAISGGTTIYNTVKVTYLYGSTTLFSTTSVSVTVNTIAALPTVTNPLGETVAPGGSVTYTYILKSNSNGLDTYTASGPTNAATGVSAATATTSPGSVTLWGGIALGSGADTITVPFGTTSSLTAGVSTVQIEASTYTVAAITPGAAAYTNGSGNLVAEIPTTLTLAPIGVSPAIASGSVTAGTQVGEYKTTALTVTFNAGTPTVVETVGTYATHFTITTGALPTALTLTTTDVTTTVTYTNGRATIISYVRNITVPNGTGTTTYIYNSNTYYATTSGVTAKPGDILEYILVATNSGSVPISASVVTDVPQTNFVTFRDNAYGTGKEITYVSDTNVVTTLSKASDGDQADYNITTPNTLTVYAGMGATNTAGGTIPAGKSVLVLYQVTVNN